MRVPVPAPSISVSTPKEPVYQNNLQATSALTPGREIEILTGMAISGAQAMCFSTGRGAPQGFPTMPVLKICGNPHTFARLCEDMDVNAGRIITGEKSIEEVGEEAFERFVRVLSGEMTHCEELEYYNSIDIYTLGPVI